MEPQAAGTPVVREPDPDVVVVRNVNGVYTFHPMNAGALLWLTQHVSPEHIVNGHVVTGPMRAAHLILWMGLEGWVLG